MRDRAEDGSTIFLDFDCKKKDLPPACYNCGYVADLLCDYPLSHRKTCDRNMCTKCAHRMGDDLDYCEAHYKRQLLPERSIESLKKEWREKIIQYLKEAEVSWPSSYKISVDLSMTDKECQEILLQLHRERWLWMQLNEQGDSTWRILSPKERTKLFMKTGAFPY